VYSAIVRLVGLASIVTCTIVIASFALFAINQTSQASNQQTRTLRGEVTTVEAGTPAPPKAAKPHESAVRRTIDDASEWLTSPFDGLTSGHSEWAVHGIDLVLALVIYGFGVGFVARTLRVRV
jgi:hypothetical protein